MRFRPIVSALLLAAYLPACTSFQATTQPVAELTAAPHPAEKVRVTTTHGARIEVHTPRVVNDTLYGSTWSTGRRGEPTAGVVAIPLATVRTVEVRKHDGTKTAVLLGGIAAVIIAGAIAASNIDYFGDGFTIPIE